MGRVMSLWWIWYRVIVKRGRLVGQALWRVARVNWHWVLSRMELSRWGRSVSVRSWMHMRIMNRIATMTTFRVIALTSARWFWMMMASIWTRIAVTAMLS